MRGLRAGGALCAIAIAVSAPPAPAAPSPAAPSPAAPAPGRCAALGTMDDLLSDLQFDLDNLRVVLRNAYASPDVKKHDEEFRIKLLINVVGRLTAAAAQSGEDDARQAAASVESGFADLESAVSDQFAVVQDEHYDFNSSIRYRTPRLVGGIPASPEAFGAADSLSGQGNDFADLVAGLRDQAGCAAPGEDETGPEPEEDQPQCRFHPGSFQCDATGSIEH